MNTKLLSVIFLFALTFGNANAQYLMPMTGTQTFNTCGGMFYDSFGPGGNYTNNENGMIVFCPALPGQYVTLIFYSMMFNDAGDVLRIYNGVGTAGLLLQTFQGPLNTSSFCGAVISQDTSGCLTAWYISNTSGVSAGWSANISCSPTPTLPAGNNCSNPSVIPSVPYTVTSHCTQCMLNDYTNQVGICNTTYAGEDRVYRYITTGPECFDVTISNAIGNPALAIYQGCPGAGGVCLTPTPLAGNGTIQISFAATSTFYIIVDEPSGYSCYDLNITPCTIGLEEANSNNSFSISPNPSSGKFTLDNYGAASQIIITNILGEKISEQKTGSSKTEINLSTQPDGIYFVQVRNEKKTFAKKMVVQK